MTTRIVVKENKSVIDTIPSQISCSPLKPLACCCLDFVDQDTTMGWSTFDVPYEVSAQ